MTRPAGEARNYHLEKNIRVGEVLKIELPTSVQEQIKE